MSEAHTADLGTRYRYRREGAEQERERIIKLIQDRVAGAKEYGKTGQIRAMQRDVAFEDLEAISEAIVYGINKESK